MISAIAFFESRSILYHLPTIFQRVFTFSHITNAWSTDSTSSPYLGQSQEFKLNPILFKIDRVGSLPSLAFQTKILTFFGTAFGHKVAAMFPSTEPCTSSINVLNVLTVNPSWGSNFQDARPISPSLGVKFAISLRNSLAPQPPYPSTPSNSFCFGLLIYPFFV